MVQGTKNETEINLAVYMERLDTYIENQNVLNQTLGSSIDSINNSLDEVRIWRKNSCHSPRCFSASYECCHG